MGSGLTFGDLAVLFGIMLIAASVPGMSVLTVSARAAADGFTQGVFTTAGIVLGDILFIVIAIFGLSLLAGVMNEYFVLIKYLGGAYLVWLGLVLWRSHAKPEVRNNHKQPSGLSSFMTGLLITLGDQKAILFYLGFFPAFVDLSAMSVADAGIIMLVAVIAVGAPKLGYAFIASRAGIISNNPRVAKAINIIAGSVMAGVGIALIAKAYIGE